MLVFGSMQDSIAPNEKSGDLRVQTGMRAVINLPIAKTHIGDAVGGTNCGTVVFFTPKWNVCVLPARTQIFWLCVTYFQRASTDYA